jgi:hypothetical protein
MTVENVAIGVGNMAGMVVRSVVAQCGHFIVMRGMPMSKVYPVDLNIRLQPPRGAMPSKADIQEVLRQIVDEGEVPRGWKFAQIQWRNPMKASRGWQTGKPADLQNLLPVLREIGVGALYDSFRVGKVRGRKPTVREKRKVLSQRQIERRLERAEEARAEAARDYKRAVRALERSKGRATRARWRDRKHEAREEMEAQEERIGHYRQAAEYEVEEYEVAASYE